MALLANAQVVRDFSGLNFSEKYTFLHFQDECTEHIPMSRSKSLPALARPSVDSASIAQEEDSFSNRDSAENVHTVMIRGIPCNCCKEDILNAVEELGFINLYDFFYVPTRKGKNKSIGYAFIGFPSTQVTKSFTESMTGYRFSRLSPKLVTVTPAIIQGYEENLEYFRKTNVMKSISRPSFCQERTRTRFSR